uniref:Uncharacterized protein n=1 Tax=Cucumis melo TaxID=3656 RepID=A0A9I9EFG4_CUCME
MLESNPINLSRTIPSIFSFPSVSLLDDPNRKSSIAISRFSNSLDTNIHPLGFDLHCTGTARNDNSELKIEEVTELASLSTLITAASSTRPERLLQIASMLEKDDESEDLSLASSSSTRIVDGCDRADQEQIEYKSYYVHETRAKYPNGGSLKVGCLYRIQGAIAPLCTHLETRDHPRAFDFVKGVKYTNTDSKIKLLVEQACLNAPITELSGSSFYGGVAFSPANSRMKSPNMLLGF